MSAGVMVVEATILNFGLAAMMSRSMRSCRRQKITS